MSAPPPPGTSPVITLVGRDGYGEAHQFRTTVDALCRDVPELAALRSRAARADALEALHVQDCADYAKLDRRADALAEALAAAERVIAAYERRRMADGPPLIDDPDDEQMAAEDALGVARRAMVAARKAAGLDEAAR